MTNTPEHLDIHRKKGNWSHLAPIAEICLALAPIVVILINDKHLVMSLLIFAPLSIWSLIPSALDFFSILSPAPILTLTPKGVHFNYPFQIGFVNWTNFKGIATQKIHWKQHYRITFQTPSNITAHFPLSKRLFFFRMYRKHDLLIPQDILSLSQKEFFYAIQHHSKVAPDHADT